MYYRVEGDKNHENVAAKSVKATIAAKPTSTATPRATAKPTATPTVTPRATTKPTATPETTGTPKAKPETTGTPTARPESTATPTATPKPTQRPVKSDVTLLASMKSSGKTSLMLTWTKVSKADGYDIFFKRCGAGDYPRIETVKAGALRRYKIIGLKKSTAYKAYVRAWKKVRGVKTTIGAASPTVHAITGGYTEMTVNPKTVTVKVSSVTLMIGKYSTIKAGVAGVHTGKKVLAHAEALRYYSSNRNVATVSTVGRIRAKGVGSCKVYVLANNGVRASVKVTVVDGPTGVSFEESGYSVKKGETLNLARKIKLTPSGATTTYTWNSSDPGIATVSARGVVKGVKKGTATITVTTANGKSANVTIRVK